MFEDYITVGHAVDRSLSGEQTLCWYVRWGVYRIHHTVLNSVILAGQSAVCVWGGVIYR